MINLTAKPVIEKLHTEIKAGTQTFHEKNKRPPRLAVILIGMDPASAIYTRKKGEAALAMGMAHETIHFPASATPAKVKATVDRLNQDPGTDGILIQRPLPKGFSEEEVLYWITPEKDVDAFHPENAGRLLLGLPCLQPCTPTGVMEILKHYEIDPGGKLVCVVGRSSIVGKPMATLLLQANATVLHCHSKTQNLAALTRQADILVIAAGKPNLFGAEYFKEGAVVIDVGIHRLPNGKLTGDVKYDEVAAKASALTPVPGGVGPTTIAILLRNTLQAAQARSAQPTATVRS